MVAASGRTILKGCELDTPAIDPTMPTRQLMRSASGMPGVVRQGKRGSVDGCGTAALGSARDNGFGRDDGQRGREARRSPSARNMVAACYRSGWMPGKSGWIGQSAGRREAIRGSGQRMDGAMGMATTAPADMLPPVGGPPSQGPSAGGLTVAAGRCVGGRGREGGSGRDPTGLQRRAWTG